MGRHDEISNRFSAVSAAFDADNPSHMSVLKKMLIKACDVSNECRPAAVSEKWVECLLSEYFSQVQKSQKRRLPAFR